MSWFKVDDGFANSRPVLRIPRRYRTQAVGLWVLAGTWCAKELTDGHVPEYLLEELAATPAIAEQLVRAGLWETVEDGYLFVGWAKYQPTREQVLTSRAEATERQKRGRTAQRKAAEQRRSETVTQVSQCDNPVTTPEHSRDYDCPDPTRPDPTRPSSVVTKGGGVTSVDAREEPPPCPKHLENSDKPCRVCKQRREWLEAQAFNRERDELEQRRRLKLAAESCPDCHGTNVIEVGDNEVIKCHHQQRKENA